MKIEWKNHMENRFRLELLDKNKEFQNIFNELLEQKDIFEFDDNLNNFILRDRSSIWINNEPYAFKDLFHLNLNEGRCKRCVFELLFLLDKFGIYSEAVECVNDYFKGTAGSSYGGHWYLELHYNNDIYLIDTSLIIVGKKDSFEKLGHKIIRKLDIDTIFKENNELIDYYDNMIINKSNL